MAAQEATGGTEFVEKPFDELLAMAKAEDKIIFIDAYTTWCGPCKQMAAKVFPLEEVGTVYNERFINAKFDMEKGEGPDLAKRYGVVAFPTYLFVDGKGDIVHKGIGYIPVEQFLELADVASGDDNLRALNKRYDGGARDPDFLKKYVEKLTELYDEAKAAEVTSVYLEILDDWNTPATIEMLVANPGKMGGKKMNFLLKHTDEVLATNSGEAFLAFLHQSIVQDYMEKNGSSDLPDPAILAPIYAETAPTLKERLLALSPVLIALRSGNMKIGVSAMIAYIEEYPSNNGKYLNGVAWMIFSNSNAPNELAAGIKFAKQAVALEDVFLHLDTLAQLYRKTGDKEMAVATAKKAIAAAKAEGEDYSVMEKIVTGGE
jgi:thiol-disulfide isomerase/thioredoxin